MLDMKNKQASEILKEFLKNGNNRSTPERFEILDAAIEYPGHFGADDLFIVLKNNKSSVSRATVYNTLELLVQCNLLIKRNFGDNMTRYESSYKVHTHDHFICRECGKIVEFTDKKLSGIAEKISDELGFDMESYSFNIYGRCKSHKMTKTKHSNN